MTWIEIVGLLTVILVVVKSLYNLGHFVYTTFLGRLLGHGIQVRKCGPWAVVTGATDGIGKAFAHSLAKEGLNVVLVSRTPEKLRAVAEEIRSATNGSVEIRTIAVDFTESQSIYPILEAELKSLEIGMLINNVGMSVGFAERYADMKEEKEIHDLINCNMMSMARMCHLVLPQMIQRKSGVIINVGSITGVVSTPMSTLYGASKAFVDKFSRDLSAEVRADGVTIQTLHPGFVVTKMSKLRKARMTAPNPDDYVAASLSTLGLESRTSGFWFHKIQMYFGELARFFAPGLMEQYWMNYMDAYRQKVLLRENKSQ